MIRILHFELSENVGGIEAFLLNLYSHVDRSEFHFEFATSAEHPAMESQLRALGAEIHHLPPKKKIGQYVAEVEKLVSYGYDAIHFHKNSAANIVPLLIAERCTKVPLFVHSHNTQPSTGRISVILHRFNRRKLLAISDVRLACSTEAGDWLYGKDSGFTVVKNGIDTTVFRFSKERKTSVRRALGLDQNTLVVLHVGRFSPQKNHGRLVSIFKEILALHPDAHLLLAGAGELKEDTKAICERLGIMESVSFLGVRNDIADIMTASDVFLLPSLYEGLPIVGVEAQASGLTVYSSDTVSPELEITDGVCWFQLEDDDTEIARKLLASFESREDEECARLSRNGQVIAAGYDITVTARFLMESYTNPTRKG